VKVLVYQTKKIIMIESVPGNNKQNKIAVLRAAILRAEKREDHEEVVLLEAQLKALEQDKEFKEDDFLIERAKKNSGARKKHHVLKDLQGLSSFAEAVEDDSWYFDGVKHRINEHFSYEKTFQKILDQLGVKSFQEFVGKKSRELKRDIKVLDLFGGAYFLVDLAHVSKIVGVRLKDIDRVLYQKFEFMLDELEELPQPLREEYNLLVNPKRVVVEGDLYEGATWRKLREQSLHTGAAFDLIVCRPEGPFGEAHLSPNVNKVVDGGLAKEEIFVSLLNRTLELLSTEGGMLFTQIPKLKANPEIFRIFWEKYVKQKQAQGYSFLFSNNRPSQTDTIFGVRRNKIPNSDV
jgi:hypothetical protein